VLFLETSEEVRDAEDVYRVLMGMGERGLLQQFAAVLWAPPKAWNFETRNNPQQRKTYVDLQYAAVLRAFAEYHPEVPLVLGVDFGHTDPQYVLPSAAASSSTRRREHRRRAKPSRKVRASLSWLPARGVPVKTAFHSRSVRLRWAIRQTSVVSESSAEWLSSQRSEFHATTGFPSPAEINDFPSDVNLSARMPVRSEVAE
jgi:hypothetical protein